MKRSKLTSGIKVFFLTFFSSLAVVGSGVIVASMIFPEVGIREYGFEDMDYTEEERSALMKENVGLEKIQTEEGYKELSEEGEADVAVTLEDEDEVEVEDVILKQQEQQERIVHPMSTKFKSYEAYFQKLKKRTEILQSKNERLENAIEIDSVVLCLDRMTMNQFKNFSSDPKIAFENALGYCSFADFAQQVQDSVDAMMREKHKESVELRVHNFNGVVVPQYVIDGVLNTKNWDTQTQTLLGNQQNIDHDITYLNNVDLSILGIKELIGVGLSKYPHSSRSRKTNLRNAASKLDGKIIHPGETLSIVDTLAPFNYNNGYVNGVIIKDGKDVTAMGGGVCQSVTTIFRSWQNSGLEVTKFQPHSKSISYYGGIGFDATMYKSAWSGGDVDLLLTNNSENSILIKVVDADPYQMMFLYGTRDREVSLKRYHFSRYAGNQVAKWKRSISYKNSTEWVDNFFEEWQKLY